MLVPNCVMGIALSCLNLSVKTMKNQDGKLKRNSLKKDPSNDSGYTLK